MPVQSSALGTLVIFVGTTSKKSHTPLLFNIGEDYSSEPHRIFGGQTLWCYQYFSQNDNGGDRTISRLLKSNANCNAASNKQKDIVKSSRPAQRKRAARTCADKEGCQELHYSPTTGGRFSVLHLVLRPLRCRLSDIKDRRWCVDMESKPERKFLSSKTSRPSMLPVMLFTIRLERRLK